MQFQVGDRGGCFGPASNGVRNCDGHTATDNANCGQRSSNHLVGFLGISGRTLLKLEWVAQHQIDLSSKESVEPRKKGCAS